MTDPVVTVSGNADGGFIVECHDGERFAAYGVMAADAKAAEAEGLKRFRPPAPVVAPVVPVPVTAPTTPPVAVTKTETA